MITKRKTIILLQMYICSGIVGVGLPLVAGPVSAYVPQVEATFTPVFAPDRTAVGCLVSSAIVFRPVEVFQVQMAPQVSRAATEETGSSAQSIDFGQPRCLGPARSTAAQINPQPSSLGTGLPPTHQLPNESASSDSGNDEDPENVISTFLSKLDDRRDTGAGVGDITTEKCGAVP